MEINISWIISLNVRRKIKKKIEIIKVIEFVLFLIILERRRLFRMESWYRDLEGCFFVLIWGKSYSLCFRDFMGLDWSLILV